MESSVADFKCVVCGEPAPGSHCSEACCDAELDALND